VSIFAEDVMEAHKQMQLASRALGLHKFLIGPGGDVCLADGELFAELGVAPPPWLRLAPPELADRAAA
jgi:hypothetical protein